MKKPEEEKVSDTAILAWPAEHAPTAFRDIAWDNMKGERISYIAFVGNKVKVDFPGVALNINDVKIIRITGGRLYVGRLPSVKGDKDAVEDAELPGVPEHGGASGSIKRTPEAPKRDVPTGVYTKP